VDLGSKAVFAIHTLPRLYQFLVYS